MAGRQPTMVEVDDVIVEETKTACITQYSPLRQRVSDLIFAEQDEVILGAFDKRCSSVHPGQAVTEYARALFLVLGPQARDEEGSRAAQLLLAVILRVLQLLHSQRLAIDKTVLDCIAFLAQQMVILPRPVLPEIVESILSHLQSLGEAGAGMGATDEDLSIELLPRCLVLIVTSVEPVVACGVVGEGAAEGRMSGHAYLDNVVHRLADIPWPNALLMRMVTILRELPVDATQMEKLLRKLFREIRGAEPQELPALVYQLLLLASKGFKRIVLEGTVTLCNRLSTAFTSKASHSEEGSKHLAELSRQIAGTVVLHINFAVKQDPTLGKELLHLLRTGQSLTPFTVSVPLSIARIPRFEQASYDFLKTAALKAYQDTQHCRQSTWASAVLGPRCTRTAQMLAQSFMCTVQSSSFGWDHIIPSVVQVGFMLLELGPAGRSALSDSRRRLDPAISDCQDLGAQILTAAFEAHTMARDEIIEQSKCRIIGLKPQQSSAIIRLLARLVQRYPQLLLDHSARLKECLDYFTFLHSASASSLVRAISPLFQLSQALQDYTVLVLRKAMFGRDAGARTTAVQGILDLIMAEKGSTLLNDTNSVPYYASEASCSQSISQRERKSDSRKGLSLLNELLGLLRRCLSQQAIVRETMYKGLPKLLLVDPCAAEVVFDIIWAHFRCFYELKEGSFATLKLSSCVKVHDGVVHLEEPIHHLLLCVYQLLELQSLGGQGQESAYDFGFSLTPEQETGLGSSGEALAAGFLNLRKSMQSKTLGDFKLDTTQNFSCDTSEGESNLEQARMLLGVLEVLMGAAVADLPKQQAEAEMELKFYLTMHDSLEQVLWQKIAKGVGPKVLKDHAKSSASGGQHANSGKQTSFLVPRDSIEKRKPLLPLSCVAHLLGTVAVKFSGSEVQLKGFQQGPQLTSESAKQSGAFGCRVAAFALRSCLAHLNSVSSESFEQPEVLSKLQVLSGTDWKILAKPLWQLLLTLSTCGITSVSQDVQMEKPKSGKAKKVPTSGTGGNLILTALKCLDEIFKLAYGRDCVIDIFKGLSEEIGNGIALSQQRNKDEGPQTDAELLHQWILAQARPMIVGFLNHSQCEETEVFGGIILFLAKKLHPSLMELHGTWAALLCQEHKVASAGAARALATMAICLSPPPRDIELAQNIALDLGYVMGTEDVDPITSSSTYPILNVSTRLVIAGFLLQHAETCLADVEWLVSKLKLQSNLKLVEQSGRSECHASGPELVRGRQEETLHGRLESVVSLVSSFTKMILPGSLAETFLKTAIRVYKCLIAATRLCISPKGYFQPLPSTKFQHLAEVTGKRLTGPLYIFIAIMQRDQQESVQRKGSVSHIKREAKTIPDLIFHVEEYEKYLIQLSKLTKVNLMRHAKRSTARDFKIINIHKQSKQPAPGQPPEEQTDADEETEEDEGAAEAVAEEEEGPDEDERIDAEEEAENDQNQPQEVSDEPGITTEGGNMVSGNTTEEIATSGKQRRSVDKYSETASKKARKCK